MTETKLEMILGAIAGFVGFFLGGADGLLIALTVFVILDYLTGVLKAASERKMNSEVGFPGIAKKLGIFFFVGIATMLDTFVFGGAVPLRAAVITFYIANEGISILENWGKMGLPLPNILKKALEQLKNKSEEDGAE